MLSFMFKYVKPIYEITKFPKTSKLRIGIVPGDLKAQFYHHFYVPAKFSKETEVYTVVNPQDWKDLEYVDMIIFHRQYHSLTVLINRYFKNKIRLHFIDDFIFNIPSCSPAYSAYQGLNLYRFKVLCYECNGVITTTEFTQNFILSERLNQNCFVVKNLLDPEIVEIGKKAKSEILKDKNTIRIGWTTTPHHAVDWPVVENALLTIKKMKLPKNIRFVFIGWKPQTSLEIEYYNPVSIEDYYQVLAYLDFDIGIAPLDTHIFNKGKTPLKLQEYGLLQIPAVASPVLAYQDWTHELNCLKPKQNKYKAWIDCLVRLINDEDFRNHIANNALNFALETCNAEIWAKERDDLYKTIYEILR